MAEERSPFPKAFVSYVREDWETVERLCDELKAAGIDVWLDKENLRGQGGARWKKVIQQAIREGDFFIACFSDAYWAKATGTYMNDEIEVAATRLEKIPPETRWFIPVRLSGCPLPGFVISRHGETLRDLQWIDLFEDWADGVQQIIDSIVPPGCPPPQVQAARMQLRSPNYEMRVAGVKTLGALGHEGGVPDLVEALDDPDAWVRSEAAWALGQIGSQAAVPALLKALDGGTPAGVRARAAEALGKIGDQRAIPGLDAALGERAHSVQVVAHAALDKIRAKQAERSDADE